MIQTLQRHLQFSCLGSSAGIKWFRVAHRRRCSARMHAIENDTRVLLVDGTNVLSRCYAGVHESIKPLVVFDLWMQYLACLVGAHVVLCVFDHPQNVRKGNFTGYKRRQRRRTSNERRAVDGEEKGALLHRKQSPNGYLWQYKTYFGGKKDHGWRMVISPEGEEADHTIASIAEDVHGQCISCQLYVASSDSDMQQCIDSRVTWLNILPCPTRVCPSGVDMVNLESFKWSGYFHPSQYNVFLTLIGKKEANVGGVGISDVTAAKLVRSFGSIDAMYEAYSSGKLRSWGIKVQNAFSGEMNFKIEKNMKIFSKHSSIGSSSSDASAWVVSIVNSDHDLHQNNTPAFHPLLQIHWNLIEKFGAREFFSFDEPTVVTSWKAKIQSGCYSDAKCYERNHKNAVYIVFIPTNKDNTKPKSEIADYMFSLLRQQSAHGKCKVHDPFKLLKTQAGSSIVRYIKCVESYLDHDLLLIPLSNQLERP
jgi:5'-3' exonuclease